MYTNPEDFLANYASRDLLELRMRSLKDESSIRREMILLAHLLANCEEMRKAIVDHDQYIKSYIDKHGDEPHHDEMKLEIFDSFIREYVRYKPFKPSYIGFTRGVIVRMVPPYDLESATSAFEIRDAEYRRNHSSSIASLADYERGAD